MGYMIHNSNCFHNGVVLHGTQKAQDAIVTVAISSKRTGSRIMTFTETLKQMQCTLLCGHRPHHGHFPERCHHGPEEVCFSMARTWSVGGKRGPEPGLRRRHGTLPLKLQAIPRYVISDQGLEPSGDRVFELQTVKSDVCPVCDLRRCFQKNNWTWERGGGPLFGSSVSTKCGHFREILLIPRRLEEVNNLQ